MRTVRGFMWELYLLAWQHIGFAGLRLYLASERLGAWEVDGENHPPARVTAGRRPPPA